jgi:uncharacterized ion transporter superfamily protein YfcC
VPPLSGIGYRLVVCVTATAITVAFVIWYAHRIKLDPTKSPMFDLDEAKRADGMHLRSSLGWGLPRSGRWAEAVGNIVRVHDRSARSCGDGQTAVLAFQLGDGFTNLIFPTSAVLMGCLALAGIPWPAWARWILPLQIVLFILGLLLLIAPVLGLFGLTEWLPVTIEGT